MVCSEKKRLQGAERLAAVAGRRLLVRRDLSQRAAVRRIEEDRVVAKATRSARRHHNPALDDAARLEQDVAAARERERAYESR